MGRRKQKWSELSRGQRFGVVLGATIQMMNGLGPIAYFLLGRKRPSAEATTGSGTNASSAGRHTALGVSLGKKL